MNVPARTRSLRDRWAVWPLAESTRAELLSLITYQDILISDSLTWPSADCGLVGGVEVSHRRVGLDRGCERIYETWENVTWHCRQGLVIADFSERSHASASQRHTRLIVMQRQRNGGTARSPRYLHRSACPGGAARCLGEEHGLRYVDPHQYDVRVQRKVVQRAVDNPGAAPAYRRDVGGFVHAQVLGIAHRLNQATEL